jgi:soluble lytic murein transglycosylase
MQIMPSAEREVLRRGDPDRERPGLEGNYPTGDLFDPEYNVRIGTTYLRLMLDRFDGDVYLALAAYNWGPTNVARVRRANPDLTGRQLVERFAPPVTREYCRRIMPGQPDRLPVHP